MKKYVTPKFILSWGPCDKYDTATIERLFGRRKRATAIDVLNAPIPIEDVFWVVLREELIPAKTLRLFACSCAERALQRERKAGREPDKRCWDAIKIVRRYAIGKATEEELSAARSAAWSAESAAWSAESAAWLAARSAESAESAEYQWQKNALLRLLSGN